METANKSEKLKTFFVTYKAPLLVFGLIALAALADYVFRSSDQDYYARGNADMTQSKYDAAIKDFSHALRQNPSDAVSRFGLGWAYHSKGWVDEALKQYEAVVKAAADTLYLAHFNSGVILQQRKRLDEAITAYEGAIAASPNAFGPIYNLGFVYADKGLPDRALQQFTRASQLEPANASTYLNAGLMCERLGRKDEARKRYQAAIAADPNQTLARERLKALGG